MLPGAYLDGLTLAERIYREDPELAKRLYSGAVITFLRDGLVILPGVIDIDELDCMDRDVHNLAVDKKNPLLDWVEIDGPREYYQARYLGNLKIDDFRSLPPGLKLVGLQRFFRSAQALSFANPLMAFLEELFGSSPALIATITFWKGSQQDLHQDFSYVHHHRRLGELAAAWIPLEDIHPDAGPLIYYKGSHFPEQLGFFDWGEGSILASRNAPDSLFESYKQHIQSLIEENGFHPSIFLPKKGDVLIWHGALIHGGTPMANPSLTRRSFVCHYTSVGSHKKMQHHRIGSGFSFDEPPTPPYKPSRLRSLFRR
jgi:phytanoyl-CoA hydroxylase